MPINTAKQKHVHKFKKIRYSSGNEMFFCALPDCNVKINPKLALGKRCICWRCGEDFILNEYSLRLAKPHCEKCHKPKEIKMSAEDENRASFETHTEIAEDNISKMSLAERLKNIVSQKNASSETTEGEDEI